LLAGFRPLRGALAVAPAAGQVRCAGLWVR